MVLGGKKSIFPSKNALACPKFCIVKNPLSGLESVSLIIMIHQILVFVKNFMYLLVILNQKI